MPTSPAAAEVLQRRREVVLQLAAEHGLSNVRVAGTGRLLVSVAEDRTYVDLADFDAAVEEALGVAVESLPDGVLANVGHSLDLDSAQPL